MHAVRSIAGIPTLVDVEDPAGDWPVLEVAAAGICSSDLALLPMGLRTTIGHEIAGTVDGVPFCVEPTVHCGTCDQCRAGMTQRCRGTARHGLLGLTFDGGMAERVAVPPECLIPLPDTLPVTDAALVEPMAVVRHALQRVGAAPGERVLVVGGGSVGLLAVAAARAAGLQVDLAARHPHQIAAGERLGAGKPNGEYPIVVESAGTASSMATCVDRAAPGGRIAVVGVNQGDWTLAGIPFLVKELTVAASYCYSRAGHDSGGHDFAAAAQILAADPEIAATVITHRFALTEAAEAFRVAADRAAGAIKVVVSPAG